MVLMVFFDVVHRRLDSPESRLGALLLKLGRLVGQRPGEGGAPWVQEKLVPVVGAAIILGLIWFGLATMRRRGTGVAGRAFELPLALLGTALAFGLGWMMTHRPSCEFYALVWALGGAAAARSLARERTGAWQLKLYAALAAIPLGALLLYRVVPEGYSWAKEVSMILLVWTGFIGASMAAHQGRHIDIDFGKKMFPARLRGPVTAFAHVVTVCFCAVLVALGMIYVFGQNGLYRLGGHFPHTQVPDWPVGFAIPWAFTWIGLRMAVAAVRVARGDLTAKGSSLTAVAPAIGGGHGGLPDDALAPDTEAAASGSNGAIAKSGGPEERS